MVGTLKLKKALEQSKKERQQHQQAIRVHKAIKTEPISARSALRTGSPANSDDSSNLCTDEDESEDECKDMISSLDVVQKRRKDDSTVFKNEQLHPTEVSSLKRKRKAVLDSSSDEEDTEKTVKKPSTSTKRKAIKDSKERNVEKESLKPTKEPGSGVIKAKDKSSHDIKAAAVDNHAKVNESESGNDEEDGNYEVEKIVDSRMSSNVRWFKVRWANYGSEDDQWIREEDANMDELVKEWDIKRKEEKTEKNSKDKKRLIDSSKKKSSSQPKSTRISPKKKKVDETQTEPEKTIRKEDQKQVLSKEKIEKKTSSPCPINHEKSLKKGKDVTKKLVPEKILPAISKITTTAPPKSSRNNAAYTTNVEASMKLIGPYSAPTELYTLGRKNIKEKSVLEKFPPNTTQHSAMKFVRPPPPRNSLGAASPKGSESDATSTSLHPTKDVSDNVEKRKSESEAIDIQTCDPTPGPSSAELAVLKDLALIDEISEGSVVKNQNREIENSGVTETKGNEVSVNAEDASSCDEVSIREVPVSLDDDETTKKIETLRKVQDSSVTKSDDLQKISGFDRGLKLSHIQKILKHKGQLVVLCHFRNSHVVEVHPYDVVKQRAPIFQSESTNHNIDFVKRIEELKPNEDFISNLDERTSKKMETLIKELEIFVYMGRFIPEYMDNTDWNRMLESRSVAERVSYLEYVAIKQRRERRDAYKDDSRANNYKQLLAEEQKKFDRGEMAYGPEMHQLITNPFRNKKRMRNIEGSRVANAIRNGYPEIAFDMQYMFEETKRNQMDLGKQLQYVISENLAARSPLPLSFINFPKTDCAERWLTQSLGFYGGIYTNQTILPEFKNASLKATYPNKEIVYISKHAREILDGPLTSDVYTFCASMDHSRQAIGAARRAKTRAVRLPLQRYVRWQSGPMFLPFPNILRIFREVHTSGGDWETALLNNISKRHLMSSEDREKKQNVINKHKEKIREKEELIRMICDGTNQTTS